MATTESWVYASRACGYTTYHATVRGVDSCHSICSGPGPLDKPVMVVQGDFRLFMEADVARALGAQMIAAADHFEAQQREAQS